MKFTRYSSILILSGWLKNSVWSYIIVILSTLILRFNWTHYPRNWLIQCFIYFVYCWIARSQFSFKIRTRMCGPWSTTTKYPRRSSTQVSLLHFVYINISYWMWFASILCLQISGQLLCEPRSPSRSCTTRWFNTKLTCIWVNSNAFTLNFNILLILCMSSSVKKR